VASKAGRSYLCGNNIRQYPGLASILKLNWIHHGSLPGDWPCWLFIPFRDLGRVSGKRRNLLHCHALLEADAPSGHHPCDGPVFPVA